MLIYPAPSFCFGELVKIGIFVFTEESLSSLVAEP